MSQLPSGARAHLHLGAQGAAVSESQRSLPRVLFAALCAFLILFALPLAWATSALGADNGSPLAVVSKSGPGSGGDGDDDDDDDSTDGTDDTNTTTSNNRGTTNTRSTTGKNKTTKGAGNDNQHDHVQQPRHHQHALDDRQEQDHQGRRQRRHEHDHVDNRGTTRTGTTTGH